MRHVPTLNIQHYETDQNSFVSKLGAAYEEFGFCCITGHGIAPELIAHAYDCFQQFFALPEQIKKKYHQPGGGGARGYTPFGVETAKDAKYPDLKEFWHIGRELPVDSKYKSIMASNIWPAEIPHFRDYGYGLYQALDTLGSRVLRALALHINLPENYFDDKIDMGNSVLRPIHYPPIRDATIPNIRAGAHEDINLITLLVGASAEGLQVLTREGEWLPITAEGDAIVVNIGDMLQRLTNHVYPSTTHRVVNPPNSKSREPRYSVPFFLHPNPDFLIDVLPNCVSENNPQRYPNAITAHDYLLERLREIRLI